jgi:hypothetical protein
MQVITQAKLKAKLDTNQVNNPLDAEPVALQMGGEHRAPAKNPPFASA